MDHLEESLQLSSGFQSAPFLPHFFKNHFFKETFKLIPQYSLPSPCLHLKLLASIITKIGDYPVTDMVESLLLCCLFLFSFSLLISWIIALRIPFYIHYTVGNNDIK